MTIAITLIAALLVIVTLLPLSGSHAWWIRMWDFPRIQIAIAQAVVLGLAFLLPSPLRWVVIAATLACLVPHLLRIRPYTPFARKEMRLAPSVDDGSEVTLLAANVLMENTRHDLVRKLIEEVDPDVVLLMETDEVWMKGVEDALKGYPTILRDPRDDCYGMLFATRLEVVEAQIVHLTADDTPSVFAQLKTPSGRIFDYVGLHPQPPVPGVDTDERDAQILYAARFARHTDVAMVTMGDFNDAAWSDTARMFKHHGRYLDPRVGRGLYASFHATNPLVRCAIDQLYVTEEVAMVAFKLGPKTGSDHHPVIARVRIDPEQARRLNVAPKALSAEEREEIDARIAAYGVKLPRPPIPV